MTRVVVTGMGVVAPNACGISDFRVALRSGTTGIRFNDQMCEKNFHCQVAAVPSVEESSLSTYFGPDRLVALNSGMTFAGIAAVECWRDAGFQYRLDGEGDSDFDTGAIIGTAFAGFDTIGDVIVPMTDAGRVRRLGSTAIERVMASNASAFIAGLLGLGGHVTTNSSACATGTEAIVMAYRHVRAGRSPRMMAGSVEGASPYIWAGFDSMRVLSSHFNHEPHRASRPMSASAKGFVPGSGAAVLMLENLESALERGCRIYAEVVGEHVNCGGQRAGGSITAANSEAMCICIKSALSDSGIASEQIDYINGHLTSTGSDSKEIYNLQRSLGVKDTAFPWINSTKSMIGHTLGAAGSIECVATVLQIADGFVHPSLNCEDLHVDIEHLRQSIPQVTQESRLQYALKTSFGFGDVNACAVFRRWSN